VSADRSAFLMERLRVRASTHLGSYSLGQLALQQAEDLLGGLVVRLATEVLATKTVGTRTYTIKHPASWWQHFKHSHAPRWFVRRRPVRMQTTTVVVDFTRYLAYPGARVALPADQFGPPVTVEVARFDVTAAWEWDAQDSPPLRFLTRHALVARILREAEDELGPCQWLDLSPRHVDTVLAALQRLGVNTNELIPADPA
jgi:hypothetical protein